ncbi:hypothetical protein BJ912DRAFT_1065865 [Pholiota molesta]|nr:hypothetical protein BJ912DRAFT_1065865 [Pholiota molesta]
MRFFSNLATASTFLVLAFFAGNAQARCDIICPPDLPNCCGITLPTTTTEPVAPTY